MLCAGELNRYGCNLLTSLLLAWLWLLLLLLLWWWWMGVWLRAGLIPIAVTLIPPQLRPLRPELGLVSTMQCRKCGLMVLHTKWKASGTRAMSSGRTPNPNTPINGTIPPNPSTPPY